MRKVEKSKNRKVEMGQPEISERETGEGRSAHSAARQVPEAQKKIARHVSAGVALTDHNEVPKGRKNPAIDSYAFLMRCSVRPIPLNIATPGKGVQSPGEV